MSMSLSLGASLTGVRSASPFALGISNQFFFDQGRYMVDGSIVSQASGVDPSFTRSTSRYVQSAGGIWSQKAVNVPPIVPGVGYRGRESWTNLAVLNGQSYTSGTYTGTNLSETILGFSLPLRVASQGGIGHGAEVPSMSALSTSTAYAVRVLYREGTSGQARVTIRNSTASLESVLNGDCGNLSASSNSAGTYSGVENIDHGGGVYEVQAIFTTNTTAGSSWSIGVGPNSTIVGEYVDFIAGQFTQKPYKMPYGSGATSADALAFDAAALGMDVSPSSAGVTMAWRGTPISSADSFGRILEMAYDGNNRIAVFLRKSSNSIGFGAITGGVQATGASTAPSGSSGVEVSFAMTWRTDGSVEFAQAGQTSATATNTPFGSPLTGIGIQNSYNGIYQCNGETKLALLHPAELSSGDLAQLAASLAS